MRSRRHKVLHSLAGKPLIHRVLELIHGAGADEIVVVLGHQADQVRKALPESIHTIVQEPQLGTGHALQVAAERLRSFGAERLLVHYGDEALVRPETLQRLVATQVSAEAPISAAETISRRWTARVSGSGRTPVSVTALSASSASMT